MQRASWAFRVVRVTTGDNGSWDEWDGWGYFRTKRLAKKFVRHMPPCPAGQITVISRVIDVMAGHGGNAWIV